MQVQQNTKSRLFDEWPDRYDEWFQTPVGALVNRYESELLLDLLRPRRGETILIKQFKPVGHPQKAKS